MYIFHSFSFDPKTSITLVFKSDSIAIFFVYWEERGLNRGE